MINQPCSKQLLKICLAVLFAVIILSSISSGEPIINATKETVSIDFLGVALEPYFDGTGTGRIKMDCRAWHKNSGIEYAIPMKFFGYSASSLKYLHVYSQDASRKDYLGFGFGQGTFAKGWGAPTTEYSENLLIACLGTDSSLIFQWLRLGWEFGYMNSTVTSFTGDNAFYPKSRFYGSVGIRLELII